jgi:tRNA(Leu) C34 or U34 (ribose-2'-O)-methylase TrmL
MGIGLLTLDLGSPYNIGHIIRQSHVLGGSHCELYIFDPRGKLERCSDAVALLSIGLVDSGEFTRIPDEGALEAFLRDYSGRVLAMDIQPRAHPLPGFEFREGDLIIIGNENTGFMNKKMQRWAGLERIDKYLLIPMLGRNYAKPDRGRPVAPDHHLHPNISVAATADIILYDALTKLGYFEGFSYESIQT